MTCLGRFSRRARQGPPGTAAKAGARLAERGNSAVEMALILPVVLVFLMGLIELGNIIKTQMTIQKAAEIGARFATSGVGISDNTQLAQIKAQVNSVLANLNSGTAVVSVCSWPNTNGNSWPTMSTDSACVNDNPGGPCDLVRVKVVFTYNPITAFAVNAIGALALGKSNIFSQIIMTASDRKVNEPWYPCSGGS